MSSEKQNKIPAWKERFLQWESDGGNAAEQENMLWEKLQGRLQPKQNRRKTFFFWAAAILILLLSGFLFLQQPGASKKKDISITTPVSPLEKPVSKKEIVAPVIRANNGVITTIQPASRKSPVTGNNEPAFLPIETVAPQEDPVMSITNAPEITTAPTVNAAPSKNKFRIVHMNEWNSPPPPTYAALRDAWMEEQKIPTTLPEPSIWPGKNKIRPVITPENSITP